MELPPRTRRIRYAWPHDGHGRGTTSAYAENTHLHYTLKEFLGNYLRVRGEYLPDPDWVPPATELPPRTRRIQRQALENLTSLGTTSAYAENTCRAFPNGKSARNYLRVRGEYLDDGGGSYALAELPPRTRRIPHDTVQKTRKEGTTSAYAENTFGGLVLSPPNGNYLRVRGEYLSAASLALPLAELPPRTRRIPRINQLLGELIGTTSAYAENTALKPPKRLLPRNYLRVRGEYPWCPRAVWPGMELPPRTRRILPLQPYADTAEGTTSAYAENTLTHI